MQTHKKISLLWKNLAGFALGLIFGFMLSFGENEWPCIKNYILPFLDLIGKIFLRLLTMLIVPLVFSSITAGAASVGDMKKLGRIGIKTLAFYLVTTAVAVIIGLFFGNAFSFGANINIDSNFQALPQKMIPLSDVVLNIFPVNPFASMVNANMLQIIIFALLFGTACVMAGEQGKKIAYACECVAQVMYSFTKIVMSLAPYGIFALISVTACNFGFLIIAPFIKVISAVYLGCIIHAVLVYSVIVMIFCKRSPFWYFNGIKETIITAFVTRSSSGTLPITLDNVRNNFGVSEGVSSFVLPLGATINMDGTALYQGVCVLFTAQAFGIDLTFGTQLNIILTAALASIGTAGIPGAGVIMLTMILQSAGLPVEGIALLAGIDVILDAARTCLNTMGDTAVCAAVASSEGEKLSQ